MEQDICDMIEAALRGRVVVEGDCDDVAFYLHFDNGYCLKFEGGWIRLLDGSDDAPEGEV